MKYILVVNMEAVLGENAKESENRARIVAEQMKVHADRILSEIEAGDFAKLHDWCVAQGERKDTQTGAYLECISDAKQEDAFSYCRGV